MRNQKYALYVCGSRGSRPINGIQYSEFGGQTSCFIIKSGTYAMVIDCGTGLYEAGPILKGCTMIDVFLTHVHYDHLLGLLDWTVFPKGARIGFYAAFREWFGPDTLNEFFKAPFWPVQPWLGPICEIPRNGTPCCFGNGIIVRNYPAPHPNGASVLSISLDGRKISIMFDCEDPNGMPIDIIEGSEYLLYDGMYDKSEYANYIGWGHSTWQSGCNLAIEGHVKNLIITHHNPKNDDNVLREMEKQAQEIFPNTRFARAKDVYEIFAEVYEV